MRNDMTRKSLAEAVTGLVVMIISMSLGILRARGLRGLLDLPAYWRLYRELRLFSEQFAALYAAFKAGTLPPVPPEPEYEYEYEPWPAEQAASARPAATPRRAGRARAPARAPIPAARPRLARPTIARIPRPPWSAPAPIAPPRALPNPLPVVRATGPPKKSRSRHRAVACPICYDIGTFRFASPAAGRQRLHGVNIRRRAAWLGDLDSNQGCPGQSREFYR